MPYSLKKVKGGYKVKASNGKVFSKKPMSKAKATRQLKHICADEK